jgi:hypothetical protein
VHPVQRTTALAAAPLCLALLLCGDGAWAQAIRLQCDVVNADSQPETRQLWEITDSAAFLDGTPFPAAVAVSDSSIEIEAEYTYSDSTVAATVRIDRTTGKITLTVSKYSLERASASQTMPWNGTCTNAPAAP